MQIVFFCFLLVLRWMWERREGVIYLRKYCCFFHFWSTFLLCKQLLNAMIEFTPSRIPFKFNKSSFFAELALKNSSLNTLAFSTVIVSPVSWHLALKISAWSSSSKIARAGLFWKIKGFSWRESEEERGGGGIADF